MSPIPYPCKGEKCMVKGCKKLASHKIGEYNIFDRERQQGPHESFNMSHELTTYLCDDHFTNIMTREEKHGLPDTRKFD